VGGGPDQPFVTESKLDPGIGNRGYGSAANAVAGRNVKLLANLGSEDAGKMRSMLANKGGGISMDFVGNPAAASHDVSSQFPVLSSQ
jgi:hypothetical protein